MKSIIISLCLVIVLVLPSIWTETQVELEISNFRTDLSPTWIRVPAVNGSLKSLRRVRRITRMSESEKVEVVRLHNMYRGIVIPSAADMEYMEWNEELATTSQMWAENCQWKHGNPIHNFPDDLGQNLYKGSNPNIAEAMRLWFEEYKDYDYYRPSCKPGKQCGHYTQIVWSTSLFVGCGIAENCWQNYKYYIVCNYWPPGNYRGMRPYKEGPPCTRCNLTGSSLCAKNSCVSRSQCRNQKLDCNCDLTCYNCGEFDSENCKCKCRDGWTSGDCTEHCVESRKCRKYECPRYERESDHPCEITCGICKGVNQSDLRNSCCDGVLCPKEQVYYPSDRPCVCRKLCHGPKCGGAIVQRPYFILLVVALFLLGYSAR